MRQAPRDRRRDRAGHGVLEKQAELGSGKEAELGSYRKGSPTGLWEMAPNTDEQAEACGGALHLLQQLDDRKYVSARILGTAGFRATLCCDDRCRSVNVLATIPAQASTAL